MKFFKVIAPAGKFLGLMPLVKVFTTGDLVASLTDAGFARFVIAAGNLNSRWARL